MLCIRNLLILLFISHMCFSINKFDKEIIERAGGSSPYYHIKLSIGSCKKIIVFKDQHLWAKLAAPRVLDIFWEARKPGKVRVSSAEINLILNSTDCSAISELGLRHREFRATVFLPPSCSRVLYKLTLWTCPSNSDKYVQNANDSLKYENLNELSEFDKFLRQDRLPNKWAHDD